MVFAATGSQDQHIHTNIGIHPCLEIQQLPCASSMQIPQRSANLEDLEVLGMKLAFGRTEGKYLIGVRV